MTTEETPASDLRKYFADQKMDGNTLFLIDLGSFPQSLTITPLAHDPHPLVNYRLPKLQRDKTIQINISP